MINLTLVFLKLNIIKMDKSYWYFCLTFIKLPSSPFLAVDVIPYITSSVIESENNLFPLMRAKNLISEEYDEMKMNITFAIQISKEDFDDFNEKRKPKYKT